jgi:hypothetical protein
MRVTRCATSLAVALCVTVLAPVALSSAGAVTPPTWVLSSTPDTSSTLSNVLYADTCVSGGACTAVGSSTTSAGHAQTLVESWNGTSWAIIASPNTSPTLDNVLYAVSCTSSSACVAVGTSTSALGQTQTLAELWNGSKWSITTTPNTSDGFDNTLSGVSCTSATACTAVGYAATATGSVTLVETLSGSTWSIATSPNKAATLYDSLNGISCASSVSCETVGNYLTATDALQTLVESWNGSIWSVVVSPDTTTAKSNTLNGVSCATATSCMAIGAAYAAGGSAYQTLAESWNGTSWSIVSTQDVTSSSDNVLEAVSCPSAAGCAASGYSTTASAIQQGLIETWNGVTWSTATNPEPGSFGNSLPAVSCPQAAACVAVGSEEPSPGVLQTVAESTFAAPTLAAPPTAQFSFGALDSFAVTSTGAPTPNFTETGAPVGVAINPVTGVVSGATKKLGTFPVTITASNGVSKPVVAVVRLTVVGMTITTTSLPPATRGVPYSAPLTSTGGAGTLVWKKDGKFPKGLKVTAAGVINGTASTKIAAGSYTVKVAVTESTAVGNLKVVATLVLVVE